jgi:polyphenol oxidase
VGPSIHACCYEVGQEVVAAFAERGLEGDTPGRVDPGAAAGTIIRRMGVDAVVVSDSCTHCDRRYFSYRRDRVTGRQGAFAALTEAT